MGNRPQSCRKPRYTLHQSCGRTNKISCAGLFIIIMRLEASAVFVINIMMVVRDNRLVLMTVFRLERYADSRLTVIISHTVLFSFCSDEAVANTALRVRHIGQKPIRLQRFHVALSRAFSARKAGIRHITYMRARHRRHQRIGHRSTRLTTPTTSSRAWSVVRPTNTDFIINKCESTSAVRNEQHR